MKFMDKNGVQRNSPVSAMIHNMTQQQNDNIRYDLQEQQVQYDISELEGIDVAILDDSPTIQANEVIKPMKKLVIDHETGEVVAYDSDGEEIRREKISDRVLYGLSMDIIDDMTGHSEVTEQEISMTADNALGISSQLLTDLIGKMNQEQVKLSAPVTEQMIDTLATTLDEALVLNPKAFRVEGSNFLKKILEKTFHKINASNETKEE